MNALLCSSTFPWMSSTIFDTLSYNLNYLNAYYGNSKQIKIWMLLFKDKPIKAGELQEAYWKRGNKNELVICIGLNSNDTKIDWVYPFSWTPNKDYLEDVKNDFRKIESFDDNQIIQVLQKDIQNFERKHFKEFSYVKVDPPLWAIITTYIITLIITLVCMLWTIDNEYANY